MLRALTIFCITVFMNGSLLWAQSPGVLVTGTVYNLVDSTTVSRVYVGTKLSFDGAITDTNGRFSIVVNADDTLYFSSIEFDKKQVPVSRIYDPTNLEVYLKPALYNIDPVTIRALNPGQFRHDFLTLDLPPDPFAVHLNLPEDIGKKRILLDHPPQPEVGFAGLGIYIAFGKTKYQRQVEQANRHISAWTAGEERLASIHKKYNPTIVKQYVPLTDEQMEAFMKYCNLDEEFILQATEYEIGTAIKDCYLAYVDENR